MDPFGGSDGLKVDLEGGRTRLLGRLRALARRLEPDGDDAAWAAYCDALRTLLAVQDGLARLPLFGREYLTTEEMARRMGVRPKTLLSRKAKGQVRPSFQAGKLIRWRPGDELKSPRPGRD